MPQSQPAHGDEQAPGLALEPGKAPQLGAFPFTQDLDTVAFDALFLASRQQHAKGTVGVADVPGVGDAHDHERAVGLGDLLQARGGVKATGLPLHNHEFGSRTARCEIHHGAQPVRSIVLAKLPFEPRTAVCATHRGS